MSEPDNSRQDQDARRLKDLQRRLAEREAARGEKKDGQSRHAQMGALGVAMRMSIELVAAVAVGGLLGLGLDRLFKTAPWIMLVGLGFGFAAGVRNAVRSAYAMQPSAKELEALPTVEDDEDD
ncbi:MAG: AtpZ/AtpI family protein [Maricaulaceae bacterium]|jgi:ATP synthase protein I